MNSHDQKIALAIAVVAACVLAIAIWAAFRRWLRRVTLRRRFARAAAGEVRAESLLIQRGYRVIARQAARQWHIAVDGATTPVDLRVDYLVEKRGRRFVVEVKTGRVAPRIDTATTRRQLLEYHVAYNADGALLVNADQKRIHEIEFRLNRRSGSAGQTMRTLFWIAIGAAIGAIWATQFRS